MKAFPLAADRGCAEGGGRLVPGQVQSPRKKRWLLWVGFGRQGPARVRKTLWLLGVRGPGCSLLGNHGNSPLDVHAEFQHTHGSVSSLLSAAPQHPSHPTPVLIGKLSCCLPLPLQLPVLSFGSHVRTFFLSLSKLFLNSDRNSSFTPAKHLRVTLSFLSHGGKK